MKSQLITGLEDKLSRGELLGAEAGLRILNSSSKDFLQLLGLADRVRQAHFGQTVQLCSIVNAKSGACSEDCAFCAQSIHHKAEIEEYELISNSRLDSACRNAAQLPISNFGMVTSGPTLSNPEVEQIVELLQTKKNDSSPAPALCASFGSLSESQLLPLKEAGLRRFHHNLETARSYFDQICSTHDYQSRVETVKTAKKVGLEVCSGGLLGAGENREQRVEFALTLRDLDVDSIPLNFLIPVEGTPLGQIEPLSPREILRTIAMFRLLLPSVPIKVCAGRKNLRDLQSLVFFAGATGMMIGDLLTVAGRDVETDLQMLEDLEFNYEQ